MRGSAADAEIHNTSAAQAGPITECLLHVVNSASRDTYYGPGPLTRCGRDPELIIWKYWSRFMKISPAAGAESSATKLQSVPVTSTQPGELKTNFVNILELIWIAN